MDNTQDKTQQTLSLKNAILSTVTRSVCHPFSARPPMLSLLAQKPAQQGGLSGNSRFRFTVKIHGYGNALLLSS
jgi:hypothetical protein